VSNGAGNVQFSQNESLDSAARSNALVALSDNVGRRKLVTDTVAGAAFAEKYMHPPSPLPAEYSGIPDRNALPGVHYEYRIEDELSINDVISALSTATRVAVFSPPSVYRKRFAFALDGINIAQVTPWNTPNPNVSFTSWNANVETYRMEYLSDTYEQDATAFNNAGMLYGAQFRPDVSLFAGSTLQTDFVSKYRSHKGVREANELIRDKMVAVINDSGLTEATPALQVQVISLGAFGPTFSGGDVLMKSPNSTSWRSTIGGYFPHRFSEPVQKYISQSRPYTTLTPPSAVVSADVITLCFYETYDPVTDTWTLSAFQSTDGSTQTWDVAKWYDMTWSVLLYDFSAAVFTGAIPAPLVHKKIFGINTTAPFGSMNLALMKARPVLDQKAMDLICLYESVHPDMLPAAANAGGFIGAIAKFAPTVLNVLSSVFGAVKRANGGGPGADQRIDKRVDELEDVIFKFMESLPNAVKAGKEVVKQVKKSVNKK